MTVVDTIDALYMAYAAFVFLFVAYFTYKITKRESK